MTTLTAKKTPEQTKSKEQLVEELAPQLMHKVKPSIAFIKKHYASYYPNEDYDSLVRGALWIAASEHNDVEIIFKKARSIVIKWIREDIQPIRAEKLRERSKNRTVPAQDYFMLPWGSRMSELQIKSGERGPLAVAIEPAATDDLVIDNDSAGYLYEILKYIMEYWGPQALSWFVVSLLNNGKYISTIEKLGVTEEEVPSLMHCVKQAERTIKRIKDDIQQKFHSMRV